MNRVSSVSEQSKDFYVVELHGNYHLAKEWCNQHPSVGEFYLKFGCRPDDWEPVLQFGFSHKEDQILFMLQFK